MTAAITYKNDVSRAELAEWYDVQRRTIYSWLKRLEEEPLEQAVHDDCRSGRFDREYSRPSCRRLMKEAGLSYQKPRRKTAEAEAEDRDTFDDELKKRRGRWIPQ